MPKITIATYNLDAKSKYKVQDIFALISENNIDYIGLQEVDIATIRNPGNILEKFKTNLNYVTHFAKTLDFEGGSYGIACATRIPVTQNESTILPYANKSELDQLSSKKTLIENRAVLKTVLSYKGKLISIYNTHLSVELSSIRERQIKHLCELIDNDPNHFKILLGDFNIQSQNELNELNTRLVKVNGLDKPLKRTLNHAFEDMSCNIIDHIFVSQELAVTSFDVFEIPWLSDHNLLKVTLTINL